MPTAQPVAAKPLPSASPKIARRQGRTRERILAESARLFLARGYPAVSVDHIVVAAEIARSSFYRFFPNREEVLSSIIRPMFESGIASMATLQRRPPRQIVAGILDMYLRLWQQSPDALRLATRMGGAYFRLFEDVHAAYRERLTALLELVAATGTLLNDSGQYSARLIARSAVPVLEVYGDDPRLESLFRRTMTGLLLKPEVRP
jgi:AcrR family transcriptional regulator